MERLLEELDFLNTDTCEEEKKLCSLQKRSETTALFIITLYCIALQF